MVMNAGDTGSSLNPGANFEIDNNIEVYAQKIARIASANGADIYHASNDGGDCPGLARRDIGD
jgi:hypothetical protein